MEIYEPRQKLVDGKPTGWHFVCSYSRGAYPIGYCSEHDPHPTADEAVACYRSWQLDNASLRTQHPDEQRKCSICSAWTQLSARPAGPFGWSDEHWLCYAHNNREGLAAAIAKRNQEEQD